MTACTTMHEFNNIDLFKTLIVPIEYTVLQQSNEDTLDNARTFCSHTDCRFQVVLPLV